MQGVMDHHGNHYCIVYWGLRITLGYYTYWGLVGNMEIDYIGLYKEYIPLVPTNNQ